jgi:gliding motility associated protien GldN
VESRDVLEYLIKEDWFFDKQRSVMEVRILGICPVAYKENPATGQIEKEQLFWLWFPEARPLLANHEVFNRYNDAERRTFDEIFHKRMFTSYITKESNVYDRLVYDYKRYSSMEQLLEAERIKEQIRNFEHDLWEY